MGYKKIIVVIACFCMLLGLACSPRAIGPKTWLDTPMHHVNNGNKMLKTGKIDAAFREFSRAKELDPMYPQAYIGLALVHGIKGDDETSFKYMKKGIDILRETINK